LRELGYIEGKNLVIEYRSADGRDERFPGLATELVRLKVDLILTRGTPAPLTAKTATGTIPVVMMAVGDPVRQGIVASPTVNFQLRPIFGRGIETTENSSPGHTAHTAAGTPVRWRRLVTGAGRKDSVRAA
jgi:hypothetical protein